MGAGRLSYDAFVQGADAELNAAATKQDDVAFWLYTSGSTGKPKGAVHLQRDMVYGADLFAIPTHSLTAPSTASE